jgi:molybdenum cofactor biosynthesis enzyme MoaA
VLQFVGVEVGDGERLQCALCAPRVSATYRPAAALASAIEAVASAWGPPPGPNILLYGPEPFDHPELPAIVAAAVRAGAERIAIETGGSALSAIGNAVGVVRAGVTHLRVRLLDTDEERGDRLCGSPGRTRDALAGIRIYLDAAESAGADVVVTAIVPVCFHNVGALPEIIVGAAQAGFHAVRLTAGGDLPANAEALIAAACDTGMVNHLWTETDGVLPLPPGHALHAVPEEMRDG